jgi:alkanesulfonate monooxygenase
MHPYTVAKMVTSLAFFYQRRLYLNMVAGGFTNDLVAPNDSTPHDKRYERLKEYTYIIKELLTGRKVSFDGVFYSVKNLSITPTLPDDLLPFIFISGSSEAGLETCRALGATAIKYPKPSKLETENMHVLTSAGIRVGIIAREREDDAWDVARARFPIDRKGQIAHQVAMKTSDSVWHKDLSQLAKETTVKEHPYWLVPFENYKTFCPYLVGSYPTVGQELARYIGMGYRTFILDIPPNIEELHHTAITFRHAAAEL